MPLETIIKFQQSVHSINGCAWEGEKCTLKFLSQNELSDLKRDRRTIEVINQFGKALNFFNVIVSIVFITFVENIRNLVWKG